MSSANTHNWDETGLHEMLLDIRGDTRYRSLNDEEWDKICASIDLKSMPYLKNLDTSAVRNVLFHLVQTAMGLLQKNQELLQEKHETEKALLQKNQDLLQENQHKDKRLKSLLQEKHETEKALLQKNQELLQENQHKDKRLESLLQENQHKDKRLNSYEDNSILGLLQLPNSDSLSVIQKGTSSSNVYTQHEEAYTEEREFNFSPIPIADEEGNDNKWKDLKNILRDKNSSFLSVNGLEFSNEADLQTYIHMAVFDAIYICNEMIKMAATEGCAVQKLSHRREASWLSPNKPDHTVIFDSTFGIDIVTIEDKKPLVDTNTGETVDIMANKPTVAGQVYDFLIAMSAVGHPNPFGIVTTLKETQFCWIKNNDVANEEESRFKFEKVVKLVQGLPNTAKNTSPERTSKPRAEPECVPESKTQANNRDSTNLQEVKQRIVYVSEKKYGVHQLVPVICNAIFCGMQNIHWEERTLSIERGRSILNGPFLQLKPATRLYKGYCWVDGTLLHSVDSATSRSEKYTVFQLLGVGETSRALRAMSEKGTECVIKMYIRMFEGTVQLKKDQFEKNAKKAVDDEVKNYHLIYPELKANVWTQQLNGFHCVVLPYFRPPKRNEKNCSLIRNVLDSKFKPKELRYAACDMRWRHVGMLGDELYLYDLADLVKCSDDGEFDNYINLHIETLQTRMGNEDQRCSCLLHSAFC